MVYFLNLSSGSPLSLLCCFWFLGSFVHILYKWVMSLPLRTEAATSEMPRITEIEESGQSELSERKSDASANVKKFMTTKAKVILTVLMD